MLLNASGCLDALTAPDVARSLDAFVTKTVTLAPREGNAPVRIAETECGMLNSIGLANPGLDRFLRETLPRLAKLEVPVWVSVGGVRAADFAEVCGRLDDREEVAAVELNVSCPNVESPAEATEAIVAAARAATGKPIYTKLSPSLPDIATVASAAAAAGSDGLSLVNTLRGVALDSRTLAPVLGTATGGLSGPALRPVALAAVFASYAATRLPIVAMGGIETGRHALDAIAAGASAYALGTVLFRDPCAPARIRAELDSEAARLGFASASDARAAAHRRAGPVVVDSDKNACKSETKVALADSEFGVRIARHASPESSGAGAASLA
jgi:dihydroorotate dehydrogenase (NAD+) catalytic subunit